MRRGVPRGLCAPERSVGIRVRPVNIEIDTSVDPYKDICWVCLICDIYVPDFVVMYWLCALFLEQIRGKIGRNKGWIYDTTFPAFRRFPPPPNLLPRADGLQIGRAHV